MFYNTLARYMNASLVSSTCLTNEYPYPTVPQYKMTNMTNNMIQLGTGASLHLDNIT